MSKQRNVSIRLRALALAGAVMLSGLHDLRAAVPDLISYKGQLLDTAGAPITAPTTLRFRIYLGGDDVTFPSPGLLVYDETALVAPSLEGIFSYLVGSGAPAASCPEGTCELASGDFGDGTQPVWIEVMIDPDMTAGTMDDDVLLPRSRIGSVGFAYRVASIAGAEAGDLSGEVSADSVTGRAGLRVGDGTDRDLELSFDLGGPDQSFGWIQSTGRFEASSGLFASVVQSTASFASQFVGVGGADAGSAACISVTGDRLYHDTDCSNTRDVGEGFIDQPEGGATLTFAPAVPGQERLVVFPTTSPSVTQVTRGLASTVLYDLVDHVSCDAYNLDCGAGRIDLGTYGMRDQWEWTYDGDATDDGPPGPGDASTPWIEKNWDFFPADGSPTVWRVQAFVLDTTRRGGDGEARVTWRLWNGGNVWNVGSRESDAGNTFHTSFNWDQSETRPAATNFYVSSSDFSTPGTAHAVLARARIDHAADWPGAEAVALSAESLFSSGDGTTLGAELLGGRFLSRVSGDATGRSVGGLTGLNVRAQATSTGALGVGPMRGVTIALDPTGSSVGITDFFGLALASPGTPGSGTTIGGGAAIKIWDWGKIAGVSAIDVEPQTGGAMWGNLRFRGGNFDDGHLLFGPDLAHLWWDSTSDAFRIKVGAPSSESDGRPLLHGSGSAGWGPMFWGSPDPSFDTGDEVCAAARLACVDTYDVGSATAVACGTPHAVRFSAFCS